MSESKARKMLLPIFCLSSVCESNCEGAITRQIPATSSSDLFTYYYQLAEHNVLPEDESRPHGYNLLPIVIGKDGSMWREASLYILVRVINKMSPNMTSYSAIADDLVAFNQFFEDSGINYKKFPPRKLLRPTYRYRGFLLKQVMSGGLSSKTASRRIASVVSFYRWAMEEGLIKPEHKPWEENDAYIRTNDGYGITLTKKVKATDVAVHVAQQADPYQGTIDDGGKLRPLMFEEQECLFESLIKIGNTEMTLVFLMALVTGARMQTILTFRVRHVLPILSGNEFEVRIPIGYGTGIDTKNDKRMT